MPAAEGGLQLARQLLGLKHVSFSYCHSYYPGHLKMLT